jgi:hypothetical protein
MTIAGMIVAITSANLHCVVNATINGAIIVKAQCRDIPDFSERSDWIVLQWDDNANDTAPDDESLLWKVMSWSRTALRYKRWRVADADMSWKILCIGLLVPRHKSKEKSLTLYTVILDEWIGGGWLHPRRMRQPPHWVLLRLHIFTCPLGCYCWACYSFDCTCVAIFQKSRD